MPNVTIIQKKAIRKFANSNLNPLYLPVKNSMIIEDVIKEVLRGWNDNVKNNGIQRTYHVDIKIRLKKFYTTKTKFYEQKVGELLFHCTGDKNLLLYRKEIEIPKFVNASTNEVDKEMRKTLINYFLYEAIGILAVQCEQLITAKDYAEYDIANDRLAQDPEYRGCVIEVIKDGEWYKIGDTFDVLTKQGSNYGVYSARPEFRANNFIGKMPARDVKVIVNPIPKIETLEDVGLKPKKKSKIIMP